MTQAERDAIFGNDEPTVVVQKAGKKPAVKVEVKPAVKVEVKPAAKSEAKPAAKSEAKPAAKSEDGEKVHGRIASTNSRKLKSDIGDCTKKSYVAIAAAFGKGKTVENAVSDLEISYEPPRSAAYKANPRKYLLGYISSMINKKLLIEA
jgi:hypothetical protein